MKTKTDIADRTHRLAYNRTTQETHGRAGEEVGRIPSGAGGYQAASRRPVRRGKEAARGTNQGSAGRSCLPTRARVLLGMHVRTPYGGILCSKPNSAKRYPSPVSSTSC